MNTPLDHFLDWLPDELKYMQANIPFQQKIDEALKEPGDSTSTTGASAVQWFHAQSLARKGIMHSSEHQNTAQLQFAKVAASIFDRYVLMDLFQIVPMNNDEENMQKTINHTIDKIDGRMRHPSITHAANSEVGSLVDRTDYRLPFEGLFEEDMITLQDDVINTAAGNIGIKELYAAKNRTLNLGVRALAGYLNFAKNLNSDQYHLAQSHIAD